MLLKNEQTYIHEKYGENSIQKYSISTVKAISHSTKTLQEYSIEQHFLSSEETYLGDGFRERQGDFFKLIEAKSYNDNLGSMSVGGFSI